MPLSILAIVVALGLVAIIAVVHFAGGSRPVAALSEDAAMASMALEHSAFQPQHSVLCDRGRTALVFGTPQLPDEPKCVFGVVVQRGRKLVRRLITPEMIAGLTTQNGVIHLRLRDFTLPQITLALADDAARAACFETLDGYLDKVRA